MTKSRKAWLPFLVPSYPSHLKWLFMYYCYYIETILLYLGPLPSYFLYCRPQFPQIYQIEYHQFGFTVHGLLRVGGCSICIVSSPSSSKTAKNARTSKKTGFRQSYKYQVLSKLKLNFLFLDKSCSFEQYSKFCNFAK